MAQTVRGPRPYRPGLVARLADGLRYRGGVGQWSWLAHRLTGLGVLLFLVIHIIDTFFVVAYPRLYDHTVGIYGGMVTGLPWEGVNGYYWQLRWGFRLGELGLIACVLYHSLNGIRIVLWDFWPGAARYQRELHNVVLIAFGALMLATTVWVARPLLESPKPWKLPGESGPVGSVPTAGGLGGAATGVRPSAVMGD